jgi:indole-3-glycerol phosphate synthase
VRTRLTAIIAEKRREISRLKNKGCLNPIGDPLAAARDFKKAISFGDRVSLIAEIKFASPSAGIIRGKRDASTIGRIYENAGAAAISLLTDKRFFMGDINDLPKLKRAVSLPVMRKDFIIDEIQLRESCLYGADAVLLIARLLSRSRLDELLRICKDLGLAALTEVHDRRDLTKAIDCGAEILGINNRNLETFKVSPLTTFELTPLIPKGRVVVSESGIGTANDVATLKKTGISAVLVGSSLMSSENIYHRTKEIADAGLALRGNES